MMIPTVKSSLNITISSKKRIILTILINTMTNNITINIINKTKELVMEVNTLRTCPFGINSLWQILRGMLYTVGRLSTNSKLFLNKKN